MLSELCKELNNWFCVKKYFGTFTIEDETLIVPELQSGQYFRIVGSVFNDGVYEYPVTGLKDETFNGAVWAMAIPAEVIALDAKISEWVAKYCGVDSSNLSPYQSESFGGYSYSKGSGSSDGGGSGNTWQNMFKSELDNWRKVAGLH